MILSSHGKVFGFIVVLYNNFLSLIKICVSDNNSLKNNQMASSYLSDDILQMIWPSSLAMYHSSISISLMTTAFHLEI